MSENNIVDEGAPVVVRDLRQEKRDAALAAKLQRDADEIANADRVAEMAEAAEASPVEETDDTNLIMNRLERMHELQALGHDRDLTDDEKEELLRLQAEEESAREEEAAQAGLDVRFAFMVIVDHDGRAYPTTDTEALYSADRLPTIDDMYAATCIIKRDIEASTAGRHVTGQLRQTAAAAMQAQQKAASRLATPPRR